MPILPNPTYLRKAREDRDEAVETCQRTSDENQGAPYMRHCAICIWYKQALQYASAVHGYSLGHLLISNTLLPLTIWFACLTLSIWRATDFPYNMAQHTD